MTEYLYQWAFLAFLALFGYQFLAYISKHSIALYCTRGKGSSDENMIRVFLQNLEDVPLQGEYRLRIRCEPGEIISGNVIRAGPRQLREDSSQLAQGVWDVYFTNLPPQDTWLFEMHAPEANRRVEVFVQPAWIAALADEARQKGEALRDFSLRGLFQMRRLPKLATESLVLPRALHWALEGSVPTPRWGLTFRVILLALIGYFLTFLLLAPSDCADAGSYSRVVLCRSGKIAELFSFTDVYFAIGLIVATLFCRWAGRRQPIPIAKGYLERSMTAPYVRTSGTQGAPQLRTDSDIP